MAAVNAPSSFPPLTDWSWREKVDDVPPRMQRGGGQCRMRPPSWLRTSAVCAIVMLILHRQHLQPAVVEGAMDVEVMAPFACWEGHADAILHSLLVTRTETTRHEIFRRTDNLVASNANALEHFSSRSFRLYLTIFASAADVKRQSFSPPTQRKSKILKH